MSSIPLKSSTIQPKGRLSYGHYMAAGNVTSSVVKTTYYGNDSTTSIADDGGSGQQYEDKTGFYLFLSKESNTFDAVAIAAGTSGATDTINLIGYKGTDRVPAYVMDLSAVTMTYDDTTGEAILTPPAYSGVTGASETGLVVSVANNGTSAATISVQVTSAFTPTSWELVFPCYIYLAGDAEMGPEVEKWYPRQEDCERVTLIYSFDIEHGAVSSSFVLELTNDSAGINCDIDGNVLSGATRPQCQAKLYFGLDDITSGATFTYTTPQAAAASGVAVDSTGKLIYDGAVGPNQLFNFLGTSLDITFIASFSGYSMMKIMTITKQYPGADGTGATTRWITLSRDEIKVNPNTESVTPSAITATIIKQVNDEEPVPDTAATLWWDWDKTSLLSNTGGTGTVIDTSGASGHTFLAVALKNSNGVYYEMETVPVLYDGADGAPGAPGASGRTGPSIIGPTEWTGADYGRRWHSGNENSADGPSQPEDLLFIDLIVRVENGQNVYYFCNTSYTEGHNDTWSSVSQYWTQSNAQYDFVATKILLAQNAYIDFLTSTGIYLRDENGNIVGGAQGSSGSTGSGATIFWAGGDIASGSTNFMVDYNGNITAKSGTFAGYLQMPYTDISSLASSGTQYDQSKTYYLDTRAYVIGHAGGIGSPNTLILPTPNSGLNGFVYYLIIVGSRTSMVTTTEGVSCWVSVADSGATILDYVYIPYGNRGFTRAGLYGGKYQFVCADVGGSFKWLLTEATGGANLYGTTHEADETNWRCFRPVFGFEDANGTPQVKNIRTITSGYSGVVDDNTMYVQL